MLEGVLRSDALHSAEEVCFLKLLEVSRYLACRHLEHSGEQRDGNDCSDHRRRLQQSLPQSVQSINAGSQDGMDGLRDIDPLGRFAEAIIPWLSLEAAVSARDEPTLPETADCPALCRRCGFVSTAG